MRLPLSGPNNYTPKTDLFSENYSGAILGLVSLLTCPRGAVICPGDVLGFDSKPNCLLIEQESSDAVTIPSGLLGVF